MSAAGVNPTNAVIVVALSDKDVDEDTPPSSASSSSFPPLSPPPSPPPTGTTIDHVQDYIEDMGKRVTLMQKEFERRETELKGRVTIMDEYALREMADLRQKITAQTPAIGKLLRSHVNITFRQVKDIINSNYNYQESIDSTTLDIVGVYLRGQKILYTEAKVYCEQNLYALMLPAIIITAMCSVISLVCKDYYFGPILVSSLTATNSFILSLVTYLKLDAKAEAHKMTAYSFENLQSMCEFSSGKILLNGGQIQLEESAMNIVNNIGNKVKEIKEKNQFVLPERIRFKYPFLCSTNVFAEVKRIQNRELVLINNLKIIINERDCIETELDKLKNDNMGKGEIQEMKTLLANKAIVENKAVNQIIVYRNQYIAIDKLFQDEYVNNIKSSRKSCCCCFTWLKT